MLEPLAWVCCEVDETYLVAEVSRAEGSDLRISLEHAAYQFIVLARSTSSSYDHECHRLGGEVSTLRDCLADMEERASKLEDILQQEQRKIAAFEDEFDNLRAKRVASTTEVEKLRSERMP
ncbi:hypothetical protein GUJ93_ZPchr0011g28619 [Zizania palustris]|uniref:Uncharacterized protein n=1 Tax=Zizania palustris TaxID=103762 RepID=A0A8J6BNZ3_ZIZPA|nr:hypothetical protein GUJ93_ZPchr0011g28619 [Zizania palustris]